MTSLIECLSYRWLNESNRAVTYENRSILLCDARSPSYLSFGWYRFGGGAGNQIPEFCVPTWRCTTHATGWLNGCHPSVTDGAVRRQVCYHWKFSVDNCCMWKNDIVVRNCRGFYVYQLRTPSGCWFRYCGNGLPSAAVPGNHAFS